MISGSKAFTSAVGLPLGTTSDGCSGALMLVATSGSSVTIGFADDPSDPVAWPLSSDEPVNLAALLAPNPIPASWTLANVLVSGTGTVAFIRQP